MKVFKLNIIVVLSVLFVSINNSVESQNSLMLDLSEQKFFVENKGQCDEVYKNIYSASDANKTRLKEQNILYSSVSNGVKIYFTAKGVLYVKDIRVPMTQPEIEEHERKMKLIEEEEEKGSRKSKKEEVYYKTISDYVYCEWENANSTTEIIANGEMSVPYGYGKYNNQGQIENISLKTFSKIVYKNIYSNIDIEYIIPKDSSGIKYNLILHPGALLSSAKLKYYNIDKISLTENGAVICESKNFSITENSPYSFNANNRQSIESKYSLNNDVISFSLPSSILTNQKEDIVIDPWTQVNGNISNNILVGGAYDINYDNSGNIYILWSHNPYVIRRYDSNGNTTGTWQLPADWGSKWGSSGNGNPNNKTYGDFAVNEQNGDCYIVEGLNQQTGARVIKVSAGTFTGAAFSTPNANLEEMWRVEYNDCLKRIVIAGGGHMQYQMAMIDPAAATPTVVLSDVINPASPSEIHRDMSLFAIDNDGSCFMSTAKSANNSSHDNVLLKCSINTASNTLAPVAGFSQSATGHKFSEIRSVNYVPVLSGGSFKATNAMNGMAVSPTSLYTYNGDELKVWNKTTGALVSSKLVRLSGENMPNADPADPIQVSWGGIAVSPCNNIFVARKSSIIQYDQSLNVVNVFSMSNDIYDIKLGKNNKLYVCGNKFVGVINNVSLTVPNLSIINVVSASCSNSNGEAEVDLSCISGIPSSLTYSWSTSPVQTTKKATGLAAGTYTVTVSSACGTTLTAVAVINSVGTTCNLAAINFDFNPFMSKYNSALGGGGTVEVDKIISFTNTSTAVCNGGTYAWEIKEWGTNNSPIHTSTAANTSFKFLAAHVNKCYAVKFSITINGCTTSKTKRICVGEIIEPCENCIGSFAPEPDKEYVLSAWVKDGAATPSTLTYTNPQILVYFPTVPSAPTGGPAPITCSASGAIIDGWQRIEQVFKIPAGSTYINLQLKSVSGDCYFDDIRVFPKDGSMTSYVYDPINLRLVAELDERNYATMYEYDEEGKLVRVKKETEKGIMTIKENKNNTKKK